jgi:hypothetical protein
MIFATMKKIKILILIAGYIEVLVGLLHFFMPLFFDKSEGFLHLFTETFHKHCDAWADF